MPNWIEGTFRARGEKENIKKFLLEGLEICGGYGKNKEILKEITCEEDSYIEIEFKFAAKKNIQKLCILQEHTDSL